MSKLLEDAARLDPQRAADLMDDEALEAERIRADLEYLERREWRIKQDIGIAHELELALMRALGWI